MQRNFVVFSTGMFRDEQPDDALDQWFLGEDCARWLHLKLIGVEGVKPGIAPLEEDWGGWTFGIRAMAFGFGSTSGVVLKNAGLGLSASNHDRDCLAFSGSNEPRGRKPNCVMRSTLSLRRRQRLQIRGGLISTHPSEFVRIRERRDLESTLPHSPRAARILGRLDVVVEPICRVGRASIYRAEAHRTGRGTRWASRCEASFDPPYRLRRRVRYWETGMVRLT